MIPKSGWPTIHPPAFRKVLRRMGIARFPLFSKSRLAIIWQRRRDTGPESRATGHGTDRLLGNGDLVWVQMVIEFCDPRAAEIGVEHGLDLQLVHGAEANGGFRER